MQYYIQDMLDFSKLEIKEFQPKFATFLLSTLIEEIERLFVQ